MRVARVLVLPGAGWSEPRVGKVSCCTQFFLQVAVSTHVQYIYMVSCCTAMGATGTNFAEPRPAPHYNLKQKKKHLDHELFATEDVSSNRYYA